MLTIVKKRINYLVLDPATSTGWCVFTPTGTIINWGYFDIDTSSEYVGDHLIDMMDKVKDLINIYSIKEVGVEDYFFSKSFKNGSNLNPAYRAAIHIQCRLSNIKYRILNISAWKNFIAGRTKPTKDERRIYGKEKSKKMMIKLALENKFMLYLPDKIMSNKTGKMINLRMDIVDAIGMAIYYGTIHLHIPVKQFNLSV